MAKRFHVGTSAPQEKWTAALAKSPKQSPPEKKFLFFWSSLGGPTLTIEHKFHAKRKWRFDFSIPERKTAFEVEGGIWTGGRHTRGSGYSKDCEKYNAAALEGWTVYRLTPQMITAPYIETLIKKINTTTK